MGVDYRVWIVPKQRAFRPDAEQLAGLANALRKGAWVPKPEAPGQRSQIVELLPGGGTAKKKPALVKAFDPEPFTSSMIAAHSDHELVLEWYVTNMLEAGVQYPFVFDPYPDSGTPPYFYIRIILTHDYMCWTGENVMPFQEMATRCVCSQQLIYDAGWGYGLGYQRIRWICPECRRSFDPSGISCSLIDGWSGEAQELAGGLTLRFALVVDCHKYFPSEEEAARRFHLRPEFLDLWRSHIGAPFEIVTTFD